MRAWLTPNELPAGVIVVAITIPDSQEMRAAFMGALLLLENEYNWEQFGTETPEDVALLWQDMNIDNFLLPECP